MPAVPNLKPTLVYLHPHFTLSGGAGKFVLETGKRLAQKGYQVKVISITTVPTIVQNYQPEIEFINIGGPLSSQVSFWLMFPVSCWRVWQAIRPLPKVILFPQVFPANWWGFVIKLFRPTIPLVWMCQEPSAFIHSRAWIAAVPSRFIRNALVILNPILSLIDRTLARSSDFVICNSQYSFQQARQVYNFPKTKMFVAHLGMDPKGFQAGKAKRALNIVTVSRLSHFKNIDDIIRAVALLHQEKSPIQLQIVGDGEARLSLEKLVKELGLQKSIQFVGEVSDPKIVAQYFKQARAFVLASVNEPFGIAPVEAMACGTPAIVTNTGGTQETVIDGRTGYYFKPRDPQDLAQKLKQVLKNDTTFSQLSAAAAKRAKTFTWDETTRKVARVLAQAKKQL